MHPFGHRKAELLSRLFDMDTYPLDKVTVNKIDSFYNYHAIASMAVQVGLIENFDNMIKSRYFDDKMKNDLQVRLHDTKEKMKYALKDYQKEKHGWDNNHIEWKILRFVHEDFFKYHGYKIDEKTGEITK